MLQARFISVVITTHNRPDALGAVVDACFAQHDKDFEIIIADDGSTANTMECVNYYRRHATVPLRHVWQPHRGFRAAKVRNLGTLAASGDYIVFLDGDCIPQRDFIAQHRKLARRGFVVTGSRVLLSPEMTERVLAQHLDLPAVSALKKIQHRLHGDLNKVSQVLLRWPDVARERRGFSYRRIKSCNLGVWRNDLCTVNGFEESFQGWGHEDTDLVLRLHNAGIRRKDGACATEVFHLWHRPARRDSAASNLRQVHERAAARVVLASQGLRSHSLPFHA